MRRLRQKRRGHADRKILRPPEAGHHDQSLLDQRSHAVFLGIFHWQGIAYRIAAVHRVRHRRRWSSSEPLLPRSERRSGRRHETSTFDAASAANGLISATSLEPAPLRRLSRETFELHLAPTSSRTITEAR